MIFRSKFCGRFISSLWWEAYWFCYIKNPLLSVLAWQPQLFHFIYTFFTFLNSRNPSQRKNIVPIKGVFTFSPTAPSGPVSPGGPKRPFGPSGPSSPLGPGTPISPCCKVENFLKICLYYFLYLKLYNIYSRYSFNAPSPLQVHSKAPYPLTLDPKVSLNSRETIFSLETHKKISKANILSSENNSCWIKSNCAC